jgi:hypothetical protein
MTGLGAVRLGVDGDDGAVPAEPDRSGRRAAARGHGGQSDDLVVGEVILDLLGELECHDMEE